MNTTEAAELARTILTDSEGYPADWLCTLNVHEARTLAHAVIRVKGLTDDREAEKLRTDIAESDAETLFERCERIRIERDVFFRQCEYALDRAEKAEAKLARVEAQAQAWEAAASMIEAHGGDTETIRDMLQDLRTALKGDDA